ncbi:MAG: phage baseplate assembly protein V [Isosphaeraceae bacterium]
MSETGTIAVPAFAISIGGKPLRDELSRRVIEIRVESHLELAWSFSIQISDDRLELIDGDDSPFRLGAEVTISLGYVNQLRPVIDGRLAALQPSFPQRGLAALTVIGYDRSHPLRHGTRFRQFDGLNDSGIVGEVAKLHTLTAESDGTGLPTRQTVYHLGTDWELLQALAVRNGFEVFVREKRLTFKKPEPAGPAVPLTWGKNLRSFSPRLSACLPQQLDLRDYDDEQKQDVVSSQTVGMLKGTFQDDAARLPGSSDGGTPFDGQWLARGRSAPTVTEANSLAASILAGLSEGIVSGTGRCPGDPRLCAGGTVEIRGVGKRCGGVYRLRQVTHRYADGGYETSFEIGPRHSSSLLDQLRGSLLGTAGAGGSGGESGRMAALTGTVVDNKDPAGRGRVRVRFPQLSANNQGPWARIATLAAGDASGTVFLPEVGDDVLVVFEQGDINRPVVVGGMWNGRSKPPEHNADGKNNVQMIRTRAGHVIKLDNTEGSESLQLAHPSGSTITMGPKGDVSIEAAGKLTLKGVTVNIN